MTRDAKVAAWLMAGVFVFSGLSPVATSFDSRWSVFIAMSLWRRGTTNLDDDTQQIRESGYYAAQCVAADGRARMGPPEACEGHWYNGYPVGGPVLAAPLVLAAVGGMHLLHPLLGRLHSGHPALDGFFQDNFDAAHPILEMEAASFLLAVTAALMYFIARRYLNEKRALILALLFALGTSAYSVGGRALWQHTPSMLLLAAIVLLLLRAGENPALAAWAGLPVALSYTVRPTDSLFVVIFTTCVALRHRRYLARYLLAAAPVAAIFVAYNWSIYHRILSPYYHLPLEGFYPRNWPVFARALAGNLFSPSRGLLVYTPLFAFSIYSMARGLWRAPLAGWLAALSLAHWVVVSSYVANWWGGHCYGPRFFTDLTPALALFLIPFLARWEHLPRAARVAFVACALAGTAMHLRGGWSARVYEWNTSPENVDRHPERNWDWKDPPFLR